MDVGDYRVSAESREILEPYANRSLSDVPRAQLFSFLVEAVANPQTVMFEQDEEGLRWTWLEHVALVWRVDLVRSEIDVILVWEGEDRA